MFNRYKIIIFSIIILAFFSCIKDNTAPVARFTIFPPAGDTATVFVFDASSSVDAENPNYALMVRWDWNNDGIWDTEFSFEKKDVHKFPDPGEHIVRLEVLDLGKKTNTSTGQVYTWGKNPVQSIIDPRDNQSYKTVVIKGKTWMAENLNIGSYIPDSMRSSDNGIIEKYLYNNQEHHNEEGGSNTYYLWEEAVAYSNIRGGKSDICPPGWHLPEASDWEELFDGYPEIFIRKFFGFGGLSSLSLSRSSYLRVQERDFPKIGENSAGIYWTSDFELCDTCYLEYNPVVAAYTDWLDDEDNIKGIFYVMKKGYLPGLYTYYTGRFNNVACPIRCIKD